MQKICFAPAMRRVAVQCFFKGFEKLLENSRFWKIAEFVFAEGHAGLVGEGQGVRGFAGVTLERLMKKGLNLPFNILVGGEGFIGNDIAGVGNPSYWGGLGVRLDIGF